QTRGLPDAREDRVVAGAEAVATGDGRGEAAVRPLEHVEIIARVEAGDDILVGGLGRAHARVGQPREPVGGHEAPREPEALPAQRMLRPVVEARPVLRVDDRGVHGRFQWPDLPPDFSTSRMSAMVTPFSTALTMS